MKKIIFNLFWSFLLLQPVHAQEPTGQNNSNVANEEIQTIFFSEDILNEISSDPEEVQIFDNIPLDKEGISETEALATESQPQPAPEPQPQPAPEPQTQPAPEPQTQPAPEPQTQPVPEPQAQPAPEPQTQPAPEPQPQPAPEPQTQPAPEPQAQPAPEPQPQPAPEPQTQPAPAPQAQPAPAPQAQPVPEPQAQPVPEPQAATTIQDALAAKTSLAPLSSQIPSQQSSEPNDYSLDNMMPVPQNMLNSGALSTNMLNRGIRISPEQRARMMMKKKFAEMDLNQDGIISKEEFIQFKTAEAQKIAIQVYHQIDQNRDDILSEAEYNVLMDKMIENYIKSPQR